MGFGNHLSHNIVFLVEFINFPDKSVIHFSSLLNNNWVKMKKYSSSCGCSYLHVLKNNTLYSYPIVEKRPILKINLSKILSPFVYFWQ